MFRRYKLRALIIALLLTTGASATSVSLLLERLRHGEDFRIRVQAALELGRTHSKRAKAPLERALGDQSAAVRAAAAAALAELGDVKSIDALGRRKNDSSRAVRAAVERAIKRLSAKQAERRREYAKAKLLLKLGKVQVMGKAPERLAVPLASASRAKLEQLPGVVLLEDDEEVQKGRVPALMITGALRNLEAAREGSQVVYSARVEFVLHRLPQEDVAGTMSGSARARASSAEASNKRKDAELQLMVVEAAIDSALRRAPEALLAAAR